MLKDDVLSEMMDGCYIHNDDNEEEEENNNNIQSDYLENILNPSNEELSFMLNNNNNNKKKNHSSTSTSTNVHIQTQEQQQKKKSHHILNQHNQQQKNNDVCYRKRIFGGAFSSSCCPPLTPAATANMNNQNINSAQQHSSSSMTLENTCELPFGVIFTPLATVPSSSSTKDSTNKKENVVEPIMCIHCLSYLNLYAPFDLDSRLWTCPICGEQGNVLPDYIQTYDDLVVSGVFSSPFMEYRHELPQQKQKHKQQLESVQKTTTTQFQRETSSNNNNNKGCCYVIVIDENISTDQMISLSQRFEHFFNDKNNNTQLGIIMYSKTVSIYQVGLGFSGICSCDVYPADDDDDIKKGGMNNSPSNNLLMKDRSYLAQVKDGGKETLLLIMKAILGMTKKDKAATTSSTSSTTTNGLSRKEILRKRREERNNNSNKNNPKKTNNNINNNNVQNTTQKHYYETRCTGTAIRYAIDLISSSSSSNCNEKRILLFTNGCCNLGVGSVVVPHNEDGKTNLSSPNPNPNTNNNDSNHNKKKPSYNSRNTKWKADVVDSSMMGTAIEYFRFLGEKAFFMYQCGGGIGMDVFCSGTSSLGIPALQAMVSPSSGYVLQHYSFSEEQFQRNLNHVLRYTRMSSSSSSSSNSNANANASANFHGCIMDIRIPKFIIPTQVIGPGEGIISYNDDEGHEGQQGKYSFLLSHIEGPIFAKCAAMAASRGIPTSNLPSQELLKKICGVRLRLGRYDPLSTFCIFFEVNEDYLLSNNANTIEEAESTKQAFFQFITRFLERDGKTVITRVHTHRLPIAHSVQDFLDGIDEEVVPVLLGREAVLRSIIGNFGATYSSANTPTLAGASLMNKQQEINLANDAKMDLDCTIHKISCAYRLLGVYGNQSEESTGGGYGDTTQVINPSLEYAFPPELVDALHMLHQLRRGLLLDPSLLSAEDRAILRDLFLRLPMEDCLCMMAPSLLSIRVDFIAPTPPGIEAFEHVPPETLVLWDNVIIAGDHHDSLFVWSGRALNQKSVVGSIENIRQVCTNYLLEQTKHRFPCPRLYVVGEGDSMARRFTSRLSPTHLDPPEQQIAHFTNLNTLMEDELMHLRNKFYYFGTHSNNGDGNNNDQNNSSFRRWFWNVASASSKVSLEGVSLCQHSMPDPFL